MQELDQRFGAIEPADLFGASNNSACSLAAVEQIDRILFEQAGPNTRFAIFAAERFDDDRLDRLR